MKNLNLAQKWYFIDSQTAKDKYNQSNSIKFETESIKSSLCDYSDKLILVEGDITVNEGNDRHGAFKNCAPFFTYKTEINDVFIDEANHIYIAMSMYNQIEYNENYPDTSGSLWKFEKDEVPDNNNDLTIDNDGDFSSQSFKYNAALVGKTSDYVDPNSFVKSTKIVVRLKYLCNFWRSLEMLLINCKILN